MSVINKVLRDLDQRASTAGAPLADPAGVTGMTRGTASVVAPVGFGAAGSARAAWLLAGAVAVVLVVAVAVWWWSGAGGANMVRHDRAVAAAPSVQRPDATMLVVAAGTAAPAAVASGGAPVVVPAQPDGPAGPADAAVAPAAGSTPLRVTPTAPVAAASAAPVTVLATPPLQAPGPPTIGRPTLAAAPVEPLVAEVARPKPVAGARPEPHQGAVGTLVPWPEAAMEAVSQAQKMWNSGARDAALDMLRDALSGTERAHGADLVPAGAGAVVGLAMVRELVRMEMLQSQHAAALALLRRHERLWAGEADLWAVRGSAAQRLAHHAESGQSYLTALKIRPGEPRWMLGAAVALAAQGQLAQAAVLADQARALGGVNPEVLAYLRQLGVALRE